MPSWYWAALFWIMFGTWAATAVLVHRLHAQNTRLRGALLTAVMALRATMRKDNEND